MTNLTYFPPTTSHKLLDKLLLRGTKVDLIISPNKQTKQKKITTILIEKIPILLYSTDGHIAELVRCGIGVVLCCVVWCGMVWYGVVWCGVILLPLK